MHTYLNITQRSYSEEQVLAGPKLEMGMFDSSHMLHHLLAVVCVSLLTPRGLNRKMQKLDRTGHLKGSDL